DRLRLAARLGIDAGIGARRVDQGQDREAEPVGQLHQADRLAVALRPRHAEIMPHPLHNLGMARPEGMPKLCRTRDAVSASFSVPSMTTLRSRNRPRPPWIAASSAKARSPARGV